jgi:hypothetical protein
MQNTADRVRIALADCSSTVGAGKTLAMSGGVHCSTSYVTLWMPFAAVQVGWPQGVLSCPVDFR